MSVDFTRLSNDVAAVASLVPQIKTQLAAATAANDDPGVQTHLDALATTLEGLLSPATPGNSTPAP